MGVDESFMADVMNTFALHPNGPDVLPMILSQACVRVLNVAGAGLSMTEDQLRVPLGASDQVAARAEALQSTLGEGPCLDASAMSDPVSADEAEMSRRWPMFHRELLARTPFRGVASVPLRSRSQQRFGALDLYVTNADHLPQLSLNEVGMDVADLIAAILFDAPNLTLQHQRQVPAWINNDSVTQRMNVWVAIGMLIEHTPVSNADALAALRAYAFSHSENLEDVADHLTSRRLQPAALLS